MGLIEGQVFVTKLEDFGQGVELVAVVLAFFVGAQVVETGAEVLLTVFVEGNGLGRAIMPDKGEALLGKIEAEAAAGSHCEGLQRVGCEGPHDGGFAGADTSGQKDAFG